MNEPNGLPGWDEMSDLDRGAAVLYVDSHEEGKKDPDVLQLPCRYFDHPALTALGDEDASAHAEAVTGGHAAIEDRLGGYETTRLFFKALVADPRRAEEQA